MAKPRRTEEGFVGYLDTPKNLRLLVQLAWSRKKGTWPVAPAASVGDVMIFYYTKPLSAFVAHAEVLGCSSELWKGRPTVKIGSVQMLRRPVPLKLATARTGLAWLKAPAGFGRRRQPGVGRIIALGNSA